MEDPNDKTSMSYITADKLFYLAPANDNDYRDLESRTSEGPPELLFDIISDYHNRKSILSHYLQKFTKFLYSKLE